MTTGAPAADAEGREGGAPEAPRGFSGGGGWHLVAFIAALGLLLSMSLDWYTTEQGEEFRRVEDAAERSTRNVDPNLDEDAAHAAEGQEATAWQADAFVDRLILIACLVAFAAAVAAAFMRATGRRPEPPRNPAAIATVAGLAGTLLILYRMFQPPGLNEVAIVKLGAPLGLVSVGLLTIGARLATVVEQEERAEARGEVAEPDGEDAEEERARRRERRGRGEERGRRRGLRRRRGASGDAGVAEPGAATAAASGPGASDEIDFDFPAPAPPGPAHTGEPGPPGPALPVPPAFPEPPEPDRAPGSLWRPEPQRPAEEAPVEEPPVAEPPVGEPPVDEPPRGPR